METLHTRKPIYTVLIAIILATIPCYTLGFIALSMHPTSPTPTSTVTPTLISTLAPTATPYVVNPETGEKGTLEPTPTQWFPPTRTPTPT
ncbi:MAG TPA: hypothetical protein G4N98_03725, partial [Thermoflexia bacterium]|nr:hypothetical protein [Thermoflexia bacterium]